MRLSQHDVKLIEEEGHRLADKIEITEEELNQLHEIIHKQSLLLRGLITVAESTHDLLEKFKDDDTSVKKMLELFDSQFEIVLKLGKKHG